MCLLAEVEADEGHDLNLVVDGLGELVAELGHGDAGVLDEDLLGDGALLEELKRSGSRLTLSEETRPIVGGLILSQGRIEINCALDTLADLHRSELAGEAARLLFG